MSSSLVLAVHSQIWQHQQQQAAIAPVYMNQSALANTQAFPSEPTASAIPGVLAVSVLAVLPLVWLLMAWQAVKTCRPCLELAATVTMAVLLIWPVGAIECCPHVHAAAAAAAAAVLNVSGFDIYQREEGQHARTFC